MIARILEFLLSFFKKTTKKESDLNKKVKDAEKKLREIENENPTDDDIVDHFNK